MRKISRAIIKQTIDRGYMRTESINHDDRPRYQGLPTDYLTRVAKKDLISVLEKYIVFKDHSQPYWIDRYWYFDVEKYQTDLEAFGIDVAMAVKEPMELPKP